MDRLNSRATAAPAIPADSPPGNRPGDVARRLLDAAFAAPGAADRLRDLDRAGRLDRALPEIVPLKTCTQPKEHYWDVFNHTLETVAAVDRIVADLPAIAAGERPGAALTSARAGWIAAELIAPGDGAGSPLFWLRWTALLHDIAKPETKAVQPDGRIRFFGHSELGAEKSRAILGRLGYPDAAIERVARLVDLHLRPGQLGDFPPTARAVRRLAREAGDDLAALLVLNLADHVAARGPRLTEAGWNAHLELIESIAGRRDEPATPEPEERLLTGYDLIEHLGIPPGPYLGSVLRRIAEARAAGQIADRADALALAERLHRASGQP